MMTNIILFYILYAIKAPVWCWALNAISVIASLITIGFKIGTKGE